MIDETDTETHGIAGFLDDLDDMLPNGVWMLLDFVGGVLALGLAWSAFADGRWFIAIATALAGGYLLVIGVNRLHWEFRGGEQEDSDQ